jgi:hypothetical protein
MLTMIRLYNKEMLRMAVFFSVNQKWCIKSRQDIPKNKWPKHSTKGATSSVFKGEGKGGKRSGVWGGVGGGSVRTWVY